MREMMNFALFRKNRKDINMQVANNDELSKKYNDYVKRVTKTTSLPKNMFHAFLTGGAICTLGQVIMEVLKARGMSEDHRNFMVILILVGISAFLTGMNIYPKIGKFGGAGSLVPITGFANSVVSPAMEYKSEGYIMGVGAKMFTVAGPVLVYGISTAIIVGFFSLLLA